ncbi:AraC family transcriptional regulator [Mucilaginibacter sp. SP1R1]|uniref:AraC family transcriptional regulator n=1 Tax=Mucilaginibacter sp. SP1R1 TaxID=2723091 RepID=UPI00160C2911|nr:AraC family transcriptional regulator [Mucilaginibacter sp. SP1R1]MBB6149660.1 AraC-like DNA-binding protein [Mucilaginibacter sp. SP1R1]
MSNGFKRRDGFIGEKLISIPQKVWRDALERDPELFQIYITNVGYFPKASFHYRERRKGCEDNILIYCLQGKGHYIIDNKRYEVHTNQFIILPATDKYMRYWADKDDPWTIYWVHYTGDNINALNKSLNLSINRGPIQIPFNEKAIEIWQTIFQTLEMGYSTENLCNASFCLYHLVATFLFPQRHIQHDKEHDGDIITKTINNMRGNLSKKLTVEDMAVKHSLSVSHFSNIFRKATGMPPIDYFIHLKMQRACQLLNTNIDKIKSVATELGYEDPYYFSRIFKKHIGTSPEQYRATVKNMG